LIGLRSGRKQRTGNDKYGRRKDAYFHGPQYSTQGA
jgi:hypothetical protein